MTNKLKLLATASGVVFAVLGANPAFATTTAGNTIANTATVDYFVGTVHQNTVNSNTNNIIVDRKVNLTVTEEGSATTTVSPGQTGAVTTFRVTNNSNAILDFDVAAAQGIAAHAGTDNFDTTITGVFVDVNNNGTYEPLTDTALYADNLAQDGGFVRVFVVATIPSTQVNGDVSGVVLTATALDAATAGTKGLAMTNSDNTTANTAGMDTVFADVAGATDAAKDAKHSARDDYTVGAPTLNVTKQSKVISDPINLASNPKMIPGAVVEYCIIVSNSSAVTADTLTISDPLPATVTFVPGSIRQGGTYTGTQPTGSCNADGVAGGSLVGTTVNGSLGTVTTGTPKTLYFQVTIN